VGDEVLEPSEIVEIPPAAPGATEVVPPSFGSVDASPPPDSSDLGSADAGPSDTAPVASAEPPPPEIARCQAPEGVSNAPRSILQAINLVNALPKPVTLSCFLESLARPMLAYATEGIISAQPAVGARSPRVFLYYDPLILSVAPDGAGRHLVEFGELVSPTRSLKGEIEFPVEAELAPEAAFERLMFTDERTVCSICHAEEETTPLLDFTGAYVSRALRPSPDERVPLANVAIEAQLCDPELEPERCATLHALFDGGDVLEWDFPDEMLTFY
jgi:hypothetical protein